MTLDTLGSKTNSKEESPYCETKSHLAGLEIPRILRNSKVHYRVQKSTSSVHIWSQKNTVHTFPPDFPKIRPINPIRLVPGGFSLGVKRPGREADHSIHLSLRSGMRGVIPPLPNTPSWCDARLKKHRDNCTLLLPYFR